MRVQPWRGFTRHATRKKGKSCGAAPAAVAFLDADKCDTKRMMARRRRRKWKQEEAGVGGWRRACNPAENVIHRHREREREKVRGGERGSSTYTCALLLRPFPSKPTPPPPPTCSPRHYPRQRQRRPSLAPRGKCICKIRNGKIY